MEEPINPTNPFMILSHKYNNLIENYKKIENDERMHLYLSKLRIINYNILNVADNIDKLNEVIIKDNDIILSNDDISLLSNLNERNEIINKYLYLITLFEFVKDIKKD